MKNQRENKAPNNGGWFDCGYADFHNGEKAQRSAFNLLSFQLEFAEKNPILEQAPLPAAPVKRNAKGKII